MSILRYKAHVTIIGLVIVMLFGLNISCSKDRTGATTNILVLHTYFEDLDYTENLKRQVRDEIRERGINADVRFVSADRPFANLEIIYRSTIKVLLKDTLKVWNWYPDIVILEDNGVFNAVTNALKNDAIAQEYLSDIPIIFSGVTDYEPEKIEGLDNITGFYTRLHIKKNAEIVKQITGCHYAFTELDNPWDSLISMQIQREIEGSDDFFYNHRWAIPDVTPEALNKEHASQFVLTPISSINDKRNIPPTEAGQSSEYHSTLTALIQSSPHLQVLFDVNSEIFVKRTNRPQFTCINKIFGSKSRYLAGYFVSQKTQRKDCMDYVEQIIKGKLPNQLPVKEHEAGYFMDWEAMKLSDMKYGDWNNRFTIINAPFDVRHSLLFYSLIGLSLAMIICGTLFLLLSFYKTKLKHNKIILEKLNKQIDFRKRILAQNNASLWILQGNTLTYTIMSEKEESQVYVNSLEKFEANVHPQTQDIFRKITSFSYPFGTFHERLFLKSINSPDYRWFNISFTITQETKKKKILYGTMIDVEEVKKTEDMLIEAGRAAEKTNIRETFLANMSHDIRTPLGCITGFSELLAESGSELDDEQKTEMATVIRQNSDMLLKLIDDAIDTTALQIGQFKFFKKVIKAKELIRLIYNTNQILSPQNIDFRMNIEADNHDIEVDLNRTQQVLNNLLSNSFKFTQNGYITIGCAYLPESDEVELYVEDTGCGISEEHIPHLFDRFYKTGEKHTGTGLGLNICQEIVTQQGGRIEVKSEVDRGSKFSCFFAAYHGKEEGDRT